MDISVTASSAPILEVAPDVMHVWRCDLRRSSVDPDVLDAQERDRAGRFVFERDRRRYVVSHVALREILARYVGVEADALTFRTGPYGKPRLERAAVEFNLTHSDEVCYVAVGSGAAIGVDAEVARDVDEVMSLAATVFSPEELATLGAAAPAARSRLFLLGWTRKEAFLKTLGLGIGEDLKRVTVGLTDEDRVVLPVRGISSEPVYVRTITGPRRDYVGVGSLKRFLRVECFPW